MLELDIYDFVEWSNEEFITPKPSLNKKNNRDCWWCWYFL